MLKSNMNMIWNDIVEEQQQFSLNKRVEDANSVLTKAF